MERKIFWMTFAVLSAVASLALPLVWGLVASVPILLFSWWFAYRSDLF